MMQSNGHYNGQRNGEKRTPPAGGDPAGGKTEPYRAPIIPDQVSIGPSITMRSSWRSPALACQLHSRTMPVNS